MLISLLTVSLFVLYCVICSQVIDTTNSCMYVDNILYCIAYSNRVCGWITICLAAEWKPLFGNVTIYDWILETIAWRLEYPMPVQDIDILTRGLSSGTACIVFPLNGMVSS